MLLSMQEAPEAKDWYTVAEVAKLLAKAEFTVREWCRLGRIHAKKRESGRGKHSDWVISHDEILRYQEKGLVPGQEKEPFNGSA